MCPPMSATELAAADNVPPMCQKAAKFMREVTEATNCFEDEVEAESRALRADNATLRADNAALTVRMKVATKTVKRSKALAGKYYDLCAESGVGADVLNAVEKQVSDVIKDVHASDEEAEEHAEEMEEEQQHVPP